MLLPLKIRVLEALDASVFQELRLLALQESPDAFGSTYESEASLPIAYVAERLSPREDGSRVLGAFSVEGALSGIIGLARETGPRERHKGFIWGMYVHPDRRREGIGRILLEHMIEHAKRVPGLRQVMLEVASSNEAAERLYEEAGFTVYGVERDALASPAGFQDEKHMVLFLCDR